MKTQGLRELEARIARLFAERLQVELPSSDGRYVMFTSDMNGSGRTDVFLVEVPTR